METNQKEANITSDVLHNESYSKLSADEISKAVKRHNREHKGDAQKAAMKAKSPKQR